MTFLFALLFFLLILVFARQAWYNGVLTQYWGILGLAGGLGAGYLFFQHSATILEHLAPDRYLPLIPNIIASGGVGLVVYFIVRTITKSILSSLFNPEGPLSGWTDGLRGAILSLIPSIITVLILVSGIRLGGTLMELRHLEYICRSEVDFSARGYPRWSAWAKWRDSVEGIPTLTTLLKPVDPVSRIPERRIVCLLVASEKPELLEFLQSNSQTAPILNSTPMQEAMTSERIALLLDNFQHVALIMHPLIRKAAHDPEATAALNNLNLQQLIDGFMLSPERQERIKGLDVVSMSDHR